MRGFLAGSRWLALGIATAIAALGALGVTLIEPLARLLLVIPLYLACVALPLYGSAELQDGIARSYNWSTCADAALYRAARSR